ncbi:unnamed protein product [Rotaria magnacalcarata]|uniref:Uncharacterized protein n=1 Tax=Rotaria magnacalcarata TaxID=392030 RepID=A0A815DNK9_9BILA|nr:unnamed protein product [Rotaria magnacalcarata]CAF2136067.1 unnamed protein product [Rotaria magnacalcarata]CAF4085639.1 unnamed protein product [Rotaria magnacalcarata]CAF4103674.1 unnamed protein product [Rotaria magnacalcarata]
MYQKILPEKHAYIATTFSNIGGVYRLMGDYEKELTFHREALYIQENIKVSPVECSLTYTYLAATYRKIKDYKTELEYFERGIEICKNRLPRNHLDLAVIYHSASKLYLDARKYDIAMKYVQQAVEVAQDKLPSNHPHLLKYRETLEKFRRKM